MNTIENVNPGTLLRRYVANREKFQQELSQYRKAIEDLNLNEFLIKSFKKAYTEHPKESDTAIRILREIHILKEKRIDLNSIVKTRKQNMQKTRIRTNKYADLYHEVNDMNRLGKGDTTITVTTENDAIYVVGVHTLESGEEKTFVFER